ncbi:MAG TPA: hypothetical protein VGH19_16130 [Verrucomicrobiae bacterium]
MSETTGAIGSVLLPTGRVIPLDAVSFDSETHRFWYGVAEVTDFLTRAQKQVFPGFNVLQENDRLADQKRIDAGLPPVVVGSTSVTEMFVKGVTDDVAGAATAARNFVTGEDDPESMSSLKKWSIAAAFLLGLFLVVQLVKSLKA